MLTLSQFVEKYMGIGIDFDHAYSFQCVDLANQAAKDLYSYGPFAGPTAASFWNSYNPLWYTKIPHQEEENPLPGDFIIWTQSSVVGTSSAGHIALCLSANKSAFISLDQNWNRILVAHKETHSYAGVLGYLRSKKGLLGETPLPTEKDTTPKSAHEGMIALKKHVDDLVNKPDLKATNDLIDSLKKWHHFTN